MASDRVANEHHPFIMVDVGVVVGIPLIGGDRAEHRATFEGRMKDTCSGETGSAQRLLAG